MKNKALKRILAYILDGLIIGIISSIFDSLLSPFVAPVQYQWFGIDIGLQVESLLLFYLLYFILFDLVNKGVTIGKLAAGIRVISEDQTHLPASKHMMRSLLKMISVLFSFLALIVFLVANRWTLHDAVMNTITVGRSEPESTEVPLE